MDPDHYGIVQSLKKYQIPFDWYKIPKNLDEWHYCPFCEQKPHIWVFDNGRKTFCGCFLEANNPYKHFSIKAESINSYAKRYNGDISNYNINALKNNWNHWCISGEILFIPNPPHTW